MATNKKKKLKKELFFLNGKAFPTLYNGTAIEKIIVFAASLIHLTQKNLTKANIRLVLNANKV